MSNSKLMDIDPQTLENIVSRAHYYSTQMVYTANKRFKPKKGEPKVGGHAATCASYLHIAGALHLYVKSGFDFMACKPHSSPMDHSYNFMLDLLLDSNGKRLSSEVAEAAMGFLRKFPENGEEVFQSYHSKYDPDRHNFLPSGTVGIPPVNQGYLALAYRYARQHGYVVPDAHFWSIIGDAEFKEGSLAEAAPDLAARELGNITWILDYNRQSLDGHRLGNPEVFDGNDDHRIEGMMSANGWEILQLRHGKMREGLFKAANGEAFKLWLECGLTDFEMQALLQIRDPKELYGFVKANHSELEQFLENISPKDFATALLDFGGHDIERLCEVMQESKENKKKPTMIIVHTIKGWGLEMAATAGNHSSLPSKKEIAELTESQGLTLERAFERFPSDSKEGAFLKKRGDELLKDIMAQEELRRTNQQTFTALGEQVGELPDTLGINLKLASYPHSQWMLGQLTAKLTRIAGTSLDPQELLENEKPLTSEEKKWKVPSELLISMAPDVGTSTNLNPAMDGKVFGAGDMDDEEEEAHVGDKKAPKLIPGEEASDRFLRFDIEECNVMSCAGSFGKMNDILGIPLMPLMTIYDFFVKRAHDQFFYNLYWNSSFICFGTPAGVTLSYEGAQHGWKSDFQIPNQITWEPMFCQELDWIFVDAYKRHLNNDNVGRTGVHIRTVTRGIDQKDFLKHLKQQKRFKVGAEDTLLQLKDFPLAGGSEEATFNTLSDDEIMQVCKSEVLQGAYYLINYEGYVGYEPGDNVVNIFALGSMGSEALLASKELLQSGIYANVIIVTSAELLVGILGHENDYSYLKNHLGIDAKLYLASTHISNGHGTADARTLSGRRVPIVSVHDGEAGFLDNLGSIIGVKQVSLAVRKHSLCGSPEHIYNYHKIDAEAIVEATGKVLSETALEQVTVTSEIVQALQGQQTQNSNWRQLWPQRKSGEVNN